MILEPLRKITRDGVHLFCRGEGCGARLGRETKVTEEDGLTRTYVDLEARYTNAPNQRYPIGAWWRTKHGAYADMPRARDARRALKALDKSTYAETVKLLQGTKLGKAAVGENVEDYDDREIRRALHGAAYYYSQRRLKSLIWPRLLAGTHSVICYDCDGTTTIEVSAVAVDANDVAR